MLKLKNVTKYYNNKKVLDRISFEIEDGEFIVLLGPSGCGKTTLLRTIAGLDTLDKGEVNLHKKVVSRKGYYLPAYKRNLNMVFQDLALWPHMNVKEHILFALSAVKLHKKEKIEKLNNLLNFFGLQQYKVKYPNQLSGGEKQRLAIARAIATAPKLLLLDEPLSNLDFLLKVSIQKMLISINKKENITIIYVTHDQIEALNLAEKIILMNEGRIEQIGTPLELLSNPKSEFVTNFLNVGVDYFKKN